MGSEIFKLKSVDLEPSVVRGARSGMKNARTTSPLAVNFSDTSVVYSGERSVRREYLVQSALAANDFKGAAVFTNNSDLVTGYTGPHPAVNGDTIRHDGDSRFYTVTGAQGNSIYLTEKYAKVEQSDPDIASGVCTVRRIVLGSVNYETYQGSETGVPFYFDKDRTEWHPTGVDASGPYVAFSGPIELSTGVEIQFLKATSKTQPDLSTIGSIRKTLVDGSKQDIVDVSLSPMPYPHSTLQVWWGVGESGLQKKTEFEDYVVNYSQSPDFAYPYPPYEERSVAYLKFLDRLTNEVQVTGIGPSTAGIVALSKEVTVPSSGAKARKPVQRVIYGTDSVKVGDTDLSRQRDYVMDYDAGTAVLVEHSHAEMPYDHVAVPREIMWNGVSVIRGVSEDEVRNKGDLVIPGVTGILGFSGVCYFEDTDVNNLVSATDYIIEYTSGAVRLVSPLKSGQAVLVSYYVEGEDVETEKLSAEDTRLNKYPILRDSVAILKRWTRTDQYGRSESGSTVLVEGTDFTMSYFTGHIKFISPTAYAEDVTSLEVTYTPLSSMNCILQSKEGEVGVYRMTVVDDALSISDAKEYAFKVNNPVVSVPVEDVFKAPGDPAKYTFSGSPVKDAPFYARVVESDKQLDTTGWTYDDQSRVVHLDKSRNTEEILEGDTVVATYTFESDVLPYAPVQVTYPVIIGGTNQFLVEGFDRTDVIRTDTILRIDNLDPVARYYFRVMEAVYVPEGTLVTVYGTFPEDINAPLFFVLDGPVVWQDMPATAILDSTSLLGATQLSFSGGALELQQDVKIGSLLMVGGTDVYTVLSADVSGSTTTIGIHPPLVRPYPTTVVHSRTPVYDSGTTDVVMKNYILGEVPEPAFTVSYVSPEGFDGSGMVFVDPENVVLFESVNGVMNPMPYIFPKAGYASVKAMAIAIQATESKYNENVLVGPRVPKYYPFTISPAGATEEQYFLDDGAYSADLIAAFEQASLARLPYTLTTVPELLKWSLLRAYRGQSSISVSDADLTGRFVNGDLMAFVGGGVTGTSYMGVTGVSVGDQGLTGVSKVFFHDSFRSNLFDPALYVKRGVRWLPLPNYGVSQDDSRTVLTFSDGFLSMVKPGTLLRFKGKYVYAVESVSSTGSSLTMRVYPPLREDCTVVGAVGGSIEQSDVPVCLTQTPDQPYVSFEYTMPAMHVAYGFVQADDEKLTLTERVVETGQEKVTEIHYADYSNMVELCADVSEIESVVPGSKPFKATVPAAYVAMLSADQFSKYRVAPCNSVMPYGALMAVGTVSINYVVPFGYTGVGSIKVGDDSVSLYESIMLVGGGDILEKVTESRYDDASVSYLSFVSDLGQVGSVADPSVHPFIITYDNTKEFVGAGSWSSTHPQRVLPETWYSWSSRLYVTTDFEGWGSPGPLNVRRLVTGQDYTIASGVIKLETPIADLDRFSMSYMGRDLRAADEGKSISATCRYFSALPTGSRLDVYMDYKAIDQYYIQKLTERNFSDLVVMPQLEELLAQMGTGNGQGTDTAPTDSAIQNWDGGVTNNYYLLQDEEIKKQLFLKFYHWYKQRLRNFSSELQLTMGFKFGKSNAVGEVDGRLTLQDTYVETEDYNLTTDAEIEVVPEAYSKFFPIGYSKMAPRYYPRFGKDYRLYNDVYCFNVRYKYHDDHIENVGYIKALKPYWTTNLDHVILKNTDDILVAYYEVPIPEDERTFSATDAKYSWLKRLAVGDQIALSGGKKKYTIMEITSGTDSQTGKPYELIKLDRAWSKRGVKKYRLRQDRDGDFWYYVMTTIPIPPFALPVGRKDKEEFLAALPAEGRNVVLSRTEAEPFPIFDDEGSYGFKIEGGEIEGYDKNDKRKNRIRKVTIGDFLSALFLIPLPELPQNVRVQVGRYNEDTLEFTPVGDDTVINISDLSRIEQRKVSSTQEGLYKNKLDDDESLPGIEAFSFLDFETVYVPDEDDGYLESFVLRSKDRDQWVRFIAEFDGEDSPRVTDVAEEYGFTANQVYKGFYDPDNIYRWLLMEKQAWQTEEALLKDIYDYNDKLARAFKQGDLRLDNVSAYKGYLANYIAGKPAGISDWLAVRLPKYERALYFLIGGYAGYGDQGSVLGIMRPDGVHDENEATSQIAQSYASAASALARYQSFYAALQEYKSINATNNATWKSDYVRWVLGLVEGLMHQKTARQMYDSLRRIEIGLVESHAISLDVVPGRYTVTAGAYAVSGDTMYLYAELKDTLDPIRLVPPYSRAFSLKNAAGDTYITLGELAGYISSGTYLGETLFNLTPVYEHYPYEDETCQMLLRGTWALSTEATNYVEITNVEDHRASDPRILFLNRMVEDKLETDNQSDPGNPYWVWPMYTANGSASKRAIEGLPVAGKWEEPTADVYEVMKVRGLDSEWSVSFDDYGDDGEGIIDAKTYMGPQDIIDKIDRGETLTYAEYEELSLKVETDSPRVSILKALTLVRRGVDTKTLTFDLRKYATVSDLVSAINSARFNLELEQDPNGTLRLFEAQTVGDEDHGRFKSYEIEVEYVLVKKQFTYQGPNHTDDNEEILSKFDYPVGWELLERSANKGSYLTFSVRPQRYSMDPHANFFMDGPEEAYQSTLTKFPLGLRKDIDAFDLYCWDDQDSLGRREYEVLANVMHFRSANVPDVTIPLSGSGSIEVADKETLKQLVDRINAHPVVGAWFYANLKFTREEERDPGYFEYGYLPDFRKSVPKASLQDFVLRKDLALRLRSTESSQYRVDPDGPYNPLDTTTVFNSLQLRILSDVRGLVVSKGSGYTFSASSMVVDDTLDTLDLSATYTYVYQYSRTFQFSDTSYDTVGELVTALNGVTIPGVGGALFSASLDNDAASTLLRQSSGALTTSPTQLLEQNLSPPPASLNAFTLAISASGPGYALSNATFSVPASRSQITVACTITYTGTYTPPTISIAAGNYTLATLATYVSTLKPYPDAVFTPIFPSSVFNGEYSGTDASDLLDVSTTVNPSGYASVQSSKTYVFAGRTLSTIAALVTADVAETGVSADVIGDYGTAEANLLVPVPSYAPIGVQTDLEADFRGLIGLRLLNMFDPAFATFYPTKVTIVADGNYDADLPLSSKDLHGWIDSVKGDLTSGMLGVQVLPIKVGTVPYGVPMEQSQALPYNEPTQVYFGVMGDIKFVQISDQSLHVQVNNVKRRLGKPWTVDGVVDIDHYTPERYDDAGNLSAIDLNHFLGWMRDTRYTQIRDGVINEALVSNKHLWLYMKFHREFGCDQRAYQLRRRIAEGKTDQTTVGRA